jgi:hypothetical protein
MTDRRCRIDKFVPAEKAIYDAMGAVEEMPPDTRLTDAVVLLQKARDKVADFVDGVVDTCKCNGFGMTSEGGLCICRKPAQLQVHGEVVLNTKSPSDKHYWYVCYKHVSQTKLGDAAMGIETTHELFPIKSVTNFIKAETKSSYVLIQSWVSITKQQYDEFDIKESG